MRILTAIVAATLVASACSSTPELVVTAPLGDAVTEGEVEQPIESDPVEEPAPTPTPTATPVPGTAPAEPDPPPPGEGSPERLLLTPNDLSGWEYTRAMAFDAEPVFETDCALMDAAWGAHAEPGTRIRAGVEGLTLRQTVVTMADEAAATAVLDAADVVWEECVLFGAGGGQWWVEPIQVVGADGWRSSGLALGLPEGTIWMIGYWQQGATIVFVDLDGESPWNTMDAVFGAVAGRLSGKPQPAPAPTPTPGEDPAIVEPTATPTPLVGTTPDEPWQDHPLAPLVPAAAEIGPGWLLARGSVSDPEPSGEPTDIPGCDVLSPEVPGGLEITYERDVNDFESGANLQIVIMDGTPAIGSDWVNAFRELADCDVTEAGFASWDVTDQQSTLADDSLIVAVAAGESGESGSAFGYASLWFGVATYDGLIVAVYGLTFSADETELDAARILELMDLVASRR